VFHDQESRGRGEFKDILNGSSRPQSGLRSGPNCQPLARPQQKRGALSHYAKVGGRPNPTHRHMLKTSGCWYETHGALIGGQAEPQPSHRSGPDAGLGRQLTAPPAGSEPHVESRSSIVGSVVRKAQHFCLDLPFRGLQLWRQWPCVVMVLDCFNLRHNVRPYSHRHRKKIVHEFLGREQIASARLSDCSIPALPIPTLNIQDSRRRASFYLGNTTEVGSQATASQSEASAHDDDKSKVRGLTPHRPKRG
jgi:hypothetical protein